jgi:hypothetical protein
MARLLVALLLLASTAFAQPQFIDFDDAPAPCLAEDTVPAGLQYAAQGIEFVGG